MRVSMISISCYGKCSLLFCLLIGLITLVRILRVSNQEIRIPAPHLWRMLLRNIINGIAEYINLCRTSIEQQ